MATLTQSKIRNSSWPILTPDCIDAAKIDTKSSAIMLQFQTTMSQWGFEFTTKLLSSAKRRGLANHEHIPFSAMKGQREFKTILS